MFGHPKVKKLCSLFNASEALKDFALTGLYDINKHDKYITEIETELKQAKTKQDIRLLEGLREYFLMRLEHLTR